MKIPKSPVLLGILALPLLLSACNRYQITLNERTIHTPPVLFSDFSLPDAGLQACVEQTISDGNVTQPGQLKALNCKDGAIQNLKGIGLFAQLVTLNLANNQLTAVEPLLALPRLDAVNLEGNPRLDCAQAATLAKQVGGEIRLPGHCR